MFSSRRRKETAAAASEEASDSTAKPEQEDSEMNILRYLRTECIDLELQSRPSPEGEDESEGARERRLIRDKEAVIQELATLLDRSGEIVNPTKFYKDMVNRERKATTGIAPGIAIPHVRSKQVRSFIMGFARAPEGGLPFASLDGTPTNLFLLLASPSWEDDGGYERLYLKVYRQFAEMVQQEWVVESLMTAETDSDIYDILRGYIN